MVSPAMVAAVQSVGGPAGAVMPGSAVADRLLRASVKAARRIACRRVGAERAMATPEPVGTDALFRERAHEGSRGLPHLARGHGTMRFSMWE